MRLSSGDYIYFYDNAGCAVGYPQGQPDYHPAWAVLDGKDPTKVLFRRVFRAILYVLKMIILPRQAPDQDRETHEKTRF
jgi:hypothetical protein